MGSDQSVRSPWPPPRTIAPPAGSIGIEEAPEVARGLPRHLLVAGKQVIVIGRQLDLHIVRLHARTVEMLEALDVTPALLAEGIRASHSRIRDRVVMDIDSVGLATAYPVTLMCPQNRTEAIARRLAEVDRC